LKNERSTQFFPAFPTKTKKERNIEEADGLNFSSFLKKDVIEIPVFQKVSDPNN